MLTPLRLVFSSFSCSLDYFPVKEQKRDVETHFLHYTSFGGENGDYADRDQIQSQNVIISPEVQPKAAPIPT